MSHYNTLFPDRRTLPYFPEERTYYSTSGRPSQWAPQHSSRTSHYIPTPASCVNPWNAVNFTSQPEYNARSAPTQYPEVSQRSVASPPSSLLDAISVYTPPYTRPASRATVSDVYSTPYADANATSPDSSMSPAPSVPVKEEQPDDDGFIIDLSTSIPQMLAPPTEVPLRATQASARMRRMMGVFRLNPFAIHAHGGRGVLAPWAGGEARPLDEPPRIFEFQLEFPEDDAPKEEEFDQSGLRAFSPEFELETERDPYQHEPETNWELAYPSLSTFDPVSTYPRALHPYQPEPRVAPAPRRWSLPQPAFLM
ncbi:hypothetical protein C8R43DRAFT_89198 [Mycena crocata]|nr:hypothetical protein C8R43DRAFT_89198 [Mycena crocata]